MMRVSEMWRRGAVARAGPQNLEEGFLLELCNGKRVVAGGTDTACLTDRAMRSPKPW